VKKFGPFPEPLLAYYIAQVLKGLQYLHSQVLLILFLKNAIVIFLIFNFFQGRY
jgi:serine/threonine protein kinase